MAHGVARVRRSVLSGLAVCAVVLPLCAFLASPAGADTPPSSNTFLYGNDRTGFDASETAINAATASQLSLAWTNASGASTTNQPVTADGDVYWSDGNGMLHATSISTGVDNWTAQLGTESASCSPDTWPDSSATVATVNGTPTVFVGGGTSQFVALNALTGQKLWTTQLSTNPAAFVWSSPALVGNNIYVGIASQGDCPQIRGELFELDASTGAIEQTLYTVPAGSGPVGCVGGTVWSSPTVDPTTGDLFVATGNAESDYDVSEGADPSCDGQQNEPYSQAILRIDPTTLQVLDSWQPAANGGDADFGATPTLFGATVDGAPTPMVGVENKNGFYYAFERSDLSAGPLWTFQVGIPGVTGPANAEYIASSAYDGTSLLVAGDEGQVEGQTCAGTLSALDPATGSPRWSDCLAGRVLGSVIAAPGIVEVNAGDQVLVDDASTGANLFTYAEPSQNVFWGPAEISDGTLYVGNMDGNMLAFRPDPPADTPESPATPLLAVVAVVVLGAGLFVARRRTALRNSA